MSEKEKSLNQIVKEIEEETSKMKGIIQHPEKKFDGWEKDFNAWEQRFNKRMKKMEHLLNEQMNRMSKFFE